MNYKSAFERIRYNKSATKILTNSSWLVSDKVFTMILGVFVTSIIARYFGPESFGEFNYALAFVSLFTAFSTLGLETLSVKSIVEKDYKEGTILYTSLFLRIIGGAILTVAAAIIIRIIDPKEIDLHVLVLILSFTMVIKSFEVIEYWIQAYQKSKISSIIRMTVYIITSGLKILLVLTHGTILGYTIIYFLDSCFISIALIISYFKVREEKSPWRLDFKYSKYILSQSWYLMLSGFMVTMYMRIDQVMLGSMVSAKEVGIYSAAARVAEMWYFVPLAIITSFKPVIMKYKVENENKYISSIQLLYTIVSWTGLLVGFIVIIFSKLIIGILYGHDFLKAASILSISIWAGTFAMLGTARSVWLVTEGLQKYTLVYTMAGLIINVVLNVILIPTVGAYGAAIATLIAQISTILVLIFFKETRVTTILIIKSFSPMPIIKYVKKMKNI
ncbi:flippase [Neobacillus mesonae]|uniref:flippase n=1 Tax=Neobacillus mesonae TaxID=1193713 RepID=UPI0025724091|nr:flippase [Neobacillus mesonae]